jgi:hypothetical protein
MSIENIPSNAWDEILEKAIAETKTSIKYLKNLSLEENQGVFIHKLASQKLGVYFQGRFIELLQTVDDTAVDLRVGEKVDFETSECVGELKAQQNTDNSSSKASNIQKLRVASQGTKQMIYGYMRSKVNKIKDGIHYLGGEELFSHFGIEHLYTQFMEEINELEKQLFDVYREKFRSLCSAKSA